MNREYDFEGRYTICNKSLKLILTRKTIHEIKLEVIPCEEHPRDSFILWPCDREDIIDKERSGE